MTNEVEYKHITDNPALDIASVMQFWFPELTVKEIWYLMGSVKISHKIHKEKIKENFKEIMYRKYPLEYDETNDWFFDKYAGKEVNVYKYSTYHNDKDDDWFILEDSNYPITSDCFTSNIA